MTLTAVRFGKFDVSGLKSTRFRAEITTLAVIGYVTFLGIILTIGLASTGQLSQLTNFMGQKTELSALKDAVNVYKAVRLDNMPPATLDELYEDPSVDAADSKTGIPVGRLLEKSERWDANGIVDMWGNEYTYEVNTDGTGSITCTSTIINLTEEF